MFLKYFLLLILNSFSSTDCGKNFNALLRYDQKNLKAEIVKIYLKDDNKCSSSNIELNANLVIDVFDKNQKKIFSKSIYINELTQIESFNKNDPLMKLKTDSVKLQTVFRPVTLSLGSFDLNNLNYKITSLKKNKVIGEGKLNGN